MKAMKKKGIALLAGIFTLASTAYAIMAPDLTVNSVDRNGSSQLTFELGNNSETPVDAYSDGFVYVYVNDQVAWTYNWKYLQETGFLNAMGTSTITSQIPKGNGDVKVCIDAREHVAESNEENNCFVKEGFFDGEATTEGLADLQVTDVYVDPLSGFLTVEYGNLGDAPVTEYNGRTSIYIDGRLKWTYRWKDMNNRPFLKPGVTAKLAPGKFNRTHEVTACVSTDTIIDEISKRNNCMTKTVSGEYVPRFEVRQPTQTHRISRQFKRPVKVPQTKRPDFTIEGVEINEDSMLVFTVKNVGRTFEGYEGRIPGTIDLYLNGQRKKSYPLSNTGDGAFLQAGGSSLVEVFPLMGGHEVRVCVDATDNVKENNEMNNCVYTLVK